MIGRLARDSALYLVPNVVARGIGLLLMPVYTRYLAPADYGALEMLTTLYALLNLVLPLEISQAMARLSPDAKSADEKSALLSTALGFTAAMFALWGLVCLTAPRALAAWLLDRPDDAYLMPLAATAMLCNALLYLLINQLRIDLRSAKFAAVNTVSLAFGTATSLILVLGMHSGVYGVIFGQLAGALSGLALAAHYCVASTPVRLRFSVPLLKSMVGFSAPLVMSSAAVYVILYADRWLVSRWVGVDAVGIYSVALRFGSIITLVSGSVQAALTPIVFRSYRDAHTPGSLQRLFELYLFLLFSVVAVVCGFAAEMVAIVSGPRFHSAAGLLPPVMLAALVTGLNAFAPGLSLARRTPEIALVNTTIAALNIGFGLLLVPELGVVGAPLATVAAGSIGVAVRFARSHRHYAIPYRWNRCLSAFALLLGIVALDSFVGFGPLARAAITIAGLALFALLLGGEAMHGRLLRLPPWPRS